MESFFQSLYKYKELDQRGQKENFLTEIFARCLTIDIYFRNAFLNSIGCNHRYENFTSQTQFLDKEFGKPDVLLTLDKHTIVLIESKVDAAQGNKQLERYANYLRTNNAENKYLIFLTKSFEEVNQFKNIKFKHLRWYKIYDLLKNSTNDLSKELSNYLKEHKMSTNISLTTLDINALKYFKETVAKMDEFLFRVKDLLSDYSKNRIVPYKKPFQGDYGISTNVSVGEIWLGFYQYEANNEMQVCVDLHTHLNSPKRKEIDKYLKLENWQTYEQNEYKVWYSSKGLSTFILNDIFDVNEACDFIKIELDKIKKWF